MASMVMVPNVAMKINVMDIMAVISMLIVWINVMVT